jgi:hypothetical protein
MSQIFIRALRHVLDPEDKNITRNPFYIEYVTSSGEVVSGDVVCTSSNFENDTFNFKFIESGEIRKVHANLILKYNDKEVMI